GDSRRDAQPAAMTPSPFMTPGQSRERRARLARRRRRRRIGAAAVAVLAAGAVAIALSMGLAKGSRPRHHGARAEASHADAHGVAAPALSPAGLPLAHRELPLPGLTRPAFDPVQLVFHHPPRAGLLFNL